jgi:hypothetical protein
MFEVEKFIPTRPDRSEIRPLATRLWVEEKSKIPLERETCDVENTSLRLVAATGWSAV